MPCKWPLAVNVLHQLLLILLRICSRSVRPTSLAVNGQKPSLSALDLVLLVLYLYTASTTSAMTTTITIMTKRQITAVPAMPPAFAPISCVLLPFCEIQRNLHKSCLHGQMYIYIQAYHTRTGVTVPVHVHCMATYKWRSCRRRIGTRCWQHGCAWKNQNTVFTCVPQNKHTHAITVITFTRPCCPTQRSHRWQCPGGRDSAGTFRGEYTIAY